MKGRKDGKISAQPPLTYLRPGPRQAARGRLEVRHTRLARAALAAAAVSVPVAVLAGPAMTAPAQAATNSQQKTVTVNAATKATKASFPLYNQVAAAVAMARVGDRYAYGGTSPAGFDCSGLTQWVYRHTGHGKRIPRMAEDQFLSLPPPVQVTWCSSTSRVTWAATCTTWVSTRAAT
jgi:cell wall-associated NlpC family hydrolase